MGAAAPIIGTIAGHFAGGFVVAGFDLAGSALALGIGRALGSMVGSSLATSLFGEKPKLPDYSTPLEDRGLLQNITGANEPIQVVYGLRRVGGVRVFAETSGSDNKYLHLVNVLGEGEIDQVQQIYLNDTEISDSKFSGEAATSEMSNVEVTQQVFRFRGNVDHILYIKVGCAESGAPTYSGSGSSGTLESGAASAGITYDESPSGYEGEGWHGDLSATIDLTPYNSALVNASKIHDATLSVASKRGGSTISIVQQPTSSNNYEAIVKIYEPNGGEGYFDFSLTFREGSNAYADHFGGEFAEAWVHTGADDQAADEELVASISGWTSAHKLSGVAYLYTRLKYDQDVFAGGIPVITADVKGVKVYDPRSASTAWSDNPALCIRDYLTNARYGRAIPTSMIDEASFIAAANYCDETVTKGGSSAKRYTLNGVVDTGRTSLEVIRELLTACRGMLVFTGGVYRLLIDKPETAAFAFTEDNILGAWSISLGDKTNTYNRVQANFFNPARAWQPDIATIDSTTLRTQDNGLLLEREITLPFTSDEATAKQIATINLNQSRQQVLTEFTATIAGLRCEVGDVVSITHSTPGWSAKKFRILRMALQNNDEVRVTALEYDETVYDFGTIATSDATPNTNLPSLTSVVAPSNLSCAESLYFNAPTLHNRVTLNWEASEDAFVYKYEVQSQVYNATGTATAGPWTDRGETLSSTFNIDDLDVGFYAFRVRAVNTMNVRSAWLEIGAQAVLGDGALPAVDVPAVSGVSESLYYSTRGSGVKAKATLSWGASTNNTEWEAISVYVDRYECESKLSSASTWTRAGTTDGVQFEFLDQQPGSWDFRVRAVNDAGVASAWSSVRQVIYGLTARPADLTGLSLQIINGQAHFGWTPSTDLDVKVGGTIRFRYSTLSSGAEWKNAIDIGQQVPGAANGTVLPLLSGTYMAKAVDSTGNESENAAAVITTVPQLLNLNLVSTTEQDPTFPGTKTNMVVDSTATPPVLKLQADLAIDSITQYMDDWGLFDAVGGLEPAGTYEFDDYVDLGFKQTWRVTPTLAFTVGDTADTIDQRTAYLDTWKDWDDSGKDMTDVIATIYIATTDDDPAGSPTWSAWKKIVVGDYEARAFKFKVEVSITDASHQIYISTLEVEVDAPDRTEWVKGNTTGTGMYSVTYANRFYVEPSLAITAQNMSSGDYYTISNESVTGFDIQFFNSGASGVSRTFNYFARGY